MTSRPPTLRAKIRGWALTGLIVQMVGVSGTIRQSRLDRICWWFLLLRLSYLIDHRARQLRHVDLEPLARLALRCRSDLPRSRSARRVLSQVLSSFCASLSEHCDDAPAPRCRPSAPPPCRAASACRDRSTAMRRLPPPCSTMPLSIASRIARAIAVSNLSNTLGALHGSSAPTSSAGSSSLAVRQREGALEKPARLERDQRQIRLGVIEPQILVPLARPSMSNACASCSVMVNTVETTRATPTSAPPPRAASMSPAPVDGILAGMMHQQHRAIGAPRDLAPQHRRPFQFANWNSRRPRSVSANGSMITTSKPPADDGGDDVLDHRRARSRSWSGDRDLAMMIFSGASASAIRSRKSRLVAAHDR